MDRQRWFRGGLLVAATFAVLALVIRIAWPRSTTFTVAGQPGEVGEWLATNATESLALDFSEGTHVALESGSRARVEQVGRRGARVEIERGSIKAHITHQPDAGWRFAAGPFEVLITGTNLEVAWNPDDGKFELGVQRGSVIVRGPNIRSPQEVRAGERYRVDIRNNTTQLEQVAATAQESESPGLFGPGPAGPSVAPPPPARSLAGDSQGRAAPQTPAWLALERAGNYAEAVAVAERSGLSKIYQSAQADDLLHLAEAARLSGRPQIERESLLACRNRFKGTPAAARAAYYLGRSSGAREAAQWFETYIREQPDGVLAREAAGRLIESYQRTGNGAAAQQAATRYLAAYPDGPHAALARQVLAR
jgi:TolA-binding protein